MVIIPHVMYKLECNKQFGEELGRLCMKGVMNKTILQSEHPGSKQEMREVYHLAG